MTLDLQILVIGLNGARIKTPATISNTNVTEQLNQLIMIVVRVLIMLNKTEKPTMKDILLLGSAL